VKRSTKSLQGAGLIRGTAHVAVVQIPSSFPKTSEERVKKQSNFVDKKNHLQNALQ
jgi:hypothetical protein